MTWAPAAILPEAVALQVPAPPTPGQPFKGEYRAGDVAGPQSAPWASPGEAAQFYPEAYAEAYSERGAAVGSRGQATAYMVPYPVLVDGRGYGPVNCAQMVGPGPCTGALAGAGHIALPGGPPAFPDPAGGRSGFLSRLTQYSLPPGRDWRGEHPELADLPSFGAPAWASGGAQASSDPAAAAASLTAPPMPAGAIPAAVAGGKPRRWSADTWAMMRRNGETGRLSPGVQPATYGASQAGAVVRYRLAMTSAHRPSAYVRTTSSMGPLRESTLALGLSARPLPKVPVVAAIEGRRTEQGGLKRMQPAAMVITELPPFPLPAGFRGEAYLQGGYIAGGYATPFADGQLRAERGLWRLAGRDLQAGGGLWGGAQKGAARLDVGPSASMAMPLGRGTYGRLTFDWRVRVLGTAHPGSGPAMTLSASF